MLPKYSFNCEKMLDIYDFPSDIEVLKKIILEMYKSFHSDYLKLFTSISNNNSVEVDFILHKLTGTFGVVFGDNVLAVIERMKLVNNDFKTLNLLAFELDVEFKMLMDDLHKFINVLEKSNRCFFNMPTINEIRKMGVDKFVDDVVNASYQQNRLDEEGIKSEEEFVEVMKRNGGVLSGDWIDALLKSSKLK